MVRATSNSTREAQMIGYAWNDGGLNNQKLALLGLMIEASRSGSAVYLPQIYSKDQRDSRSGLFEFSDIFWEDMFRGFAARWNVVISDSPESIVYTDRIERCGWNYFNSGAWNIGHLRLTGLNAKDITADFCRSLRPRVANSALFQNIADQIFNKNSINTVVQTRYEEDWRIHSQYNLDPVLGGGEDYCISPSSIIMKVKNSLSDTGGRVYVSCDERYMPAHKEHMRQEILKATGIETLWKSDFLDEVTFNEMTPLDASLIDFEIARLSDRFVGLSRSTFANLVSFERFAVAYRNRNVDYIYNLPGPTLGKRVDAGTSDDPLVACGQSR